MNIDRLFTVVGSALDSQRQRINIIAGNLANSESTRSPEGGPYVRRDVVFKSESHLPRLLKSFHGRLEDRPNRMAFKWRRSFRIKGLLAGFTIQNILMPMNKEWFTFPTSTSSKK